MKLQFLGTSGAEGWPGLFCNCEQCETARLLGGKNIRTRSQAVIYADAVGAGDVDDILLIDLPPDTYMHCLQHGLRMDRIGHLIVTHSHDDHFAPGELAYRRDKHVNTVPDFPLQIYGNETVELCYRNAVFHLGQENLSAGIEFHVVENFVTFRAGEYLVTSLAAKHDPKERCLIYMIEHNGKRILYGTDTAMFPEETWDYIAGKPFDLVSLDCTHCAESGGEFHLGLPDAVSVKRRMDMIGCLKPATKFVLTHFAHLNGKCYDVMVELAADYNMEVAYDGGVWEI